MPQITTVTVRLVITLLGSSMPQPDPSQLTKLKRIFEPLHQQLAADLPEPQV